MNEKCANPSDGTLRLPGEVWGVSAFFNPTHSFLLENNLARFSAGVRRQGLKLLIVELAFGSEPFQVSEDLADIVVRRRSSTVLWHKERLLNIGIEHLPPSCDKVVWLDADILFENPGWVADVCQLLEQFVVLQPFESCCWLERDAMSAGTSLPRGLGEAKTMPSMAAALASHTDRRKALSDYFEHGHTGFAWAARRALLDRHRLYDRRILGGGDVILAHSIYGDRDFWLGRNFYCRQMTKQEIASAASWGRRLEQDIQGSISFCPGRVLHLWHGGVQQRAYMDRMKILKENSFDPDRDLSMDEAGCWRWATDKPDLHASVEQYFSQREQPQTVGVGCA